MSVHATQSKRNSFRVFDLLKTDNIQRSTKRKKKPRPKYADLVNGDLAHFNFKYRFGNNKLLSCDVC